MHSGSNTGSPDLVALLWRGRWLRVCGANTLPCIRSVGVNSVQACWRAAAKRLWQSLARGGSCPKGGRTPHAPSEERGRSGKRARGGSSSTAPCRCNRCASRTDPAGCRLAGGVWIEGSPALSHSFPKSKSQKMIHAEAFELVVRLLSPEFEVLEFATGSGPTSRDSFALPE